jgi:hypothetical protein
LNRNRRSGLKHFIFAAFLLIAVSVAQAQPAANVSRIILEGTIGQNRIGMTLLVNPAGTVMGGHYFYANDLKDIPLRAGTQGTGIVLYGPEGGQFALQFKGNGSEADKPLNFHNSIGMEGRWMKGASSYPLELQTKATTEGRANARWYQDVTGESDAAFEAKVQSFYNAVLSGDRSSAARFIDFPLRINHAGKSRTIRSAAQLSAQWKQIFTPACIAALKKAIPHDMFVRNGQAMLGDGVVWFGPKGAQSINIP